MDAAFAVEIAQAPCNEPRSIASSSLLLFANRETPTFIPPPSKLSPMGHDHHHQHHHGGHSHSPFAAGVALNVVFVALELSVGYWANSLALIADACHNLSDVLGLLLAWGAAALTATRPTERRTYGLRRSSILAALGNAVLLLIAAGGIAWEAVRRLQQPEPSAGLTVIAIALVGLVINGGTAALFFTGRKHDLNIRGAFLHMAADAAVSAGVAVAGVVIYFTGLAWIDPAVTLVIVVVIGVGSWNLLRESLDLALDAVPAGIDPAAVAAYLEQLPGISAAHDLHIWAMSTTEVALTVHLVKPDGLIDDAFLERVEDELFHRFGIQHATLQLESNSQHGCSLHRDHGAN